MELFNSKANLFQISTLLTCLCSKMYITTWTYQFFWMKNVGQKYIYVYILKILSCFFNIINDCILIYQPICHSNRTALKITTSTIVAFYSIFWNTRFQIDSVWQSITIFFKKEKIKNFKYICSMILFNKHIDF